VEFGHDFSKRKPVAGEGRWWVSDEDAFVLVLRLVQTLLGTIPLRCAEHLFVECKVNSLPW
jgi:hypothetical protein